ncbi:MAG: hypothetical protein V7785_04400 [Bermanella sp.]
MRFKIVLWFLGLALEKAAKNNQKFQKKLEGKNLTLEISSEDGAAYHYIFKDKTVMSYPGRASCPTFLSEPHQPDITIRFKNAKTGFKTFTSKNKQLAMIGGIQNKNICIKGNPLFLSWFQALAKLATP